MPPFSPGCAFSFLAVLLLPLDLYVLLAGGPSPGLADSPALDARVVVLVNQLAHAILLILKDGHVELDAVRDALARTRALAVLHPRLRRKVAALGAVESRVETAVVGTRVGDDELAWVLNHARERNAVLLQQRRRDEQLLVPEKLGARAPHLGDHALRQNLESLAIFGRDRVPKLGRAEMEVVDAVEVEVLRVPREQRAPHAKVQVRAVHPLQRDVLALQGTREERVQAGDVPAPVGFVKEGPGDVGAVRGRVVRHLLPELALQDLWGRGMRVMGQSYVGCAGGKCTKEASGVEKVRWFFVERVVFFRGNAPRCP